VGCLAAGRSCHSFSRPGRSTSCPNAWPPDRLIEYSVETKGATRRPPRSTSRCGSCSPPHRLAPTPHLPRRVRPSSVPCLKSHPCDLPCPSCGPVRGSAAPRPRPRRRWSATRRARSSCGPSSTSPTRISSICARITGPGSDPRVGGRSRATASDRQSRPEPARGRVAVRRTRPSPGRTPGPSRGGCGRSPR
jgi:hypothetical protein